MDFGTVLVILLFVGMMAMHLRGHGEHRAGAHGRDGHGAAGGCCGGHGGREQHGAEHARGRDLDAAHDEHTTHA